MILTSTSKYHFIGFPIGRCYILSTTGFPACDTMQLIYRIAISKKNFMQMQPLTSI